MPEIMPKPGPHLGQALTLSPRVSDPDACCHLRMWSRIYSCIGRFVSIRETVCLQKPSAIFLQAFKPLTELLTLAADAPDSAEERADADIVRHLLRWLRGAQLQVCADIGLVSPVCAVLAQPVRVFSPMSP